LLYSRVGDGAKAAGAGAASKFLLRAEAAKKDAAPQHCKKNLWISTSLDNDSQQPAREVFLEGLCLKKKIVKRWYSQTGL
jgi:hypothetical protein